MSSDEEREPIAWKQDHNGEWEAEPEWNGRTCPYYARYFGLPGHDPNATCQGGCSDEPSCITDEPLEGWPALTEDAGSGAPASPSSRAFGPRTTT